MAPSAIPKVAVGPTQWTAGLYKTYDGCLAKPEVTQLSAVTPPAHVLTSTPELAAAIKCMSEKGDIAQCTDKFDDMKKLGGFTEEETIATSTKVKNLAYKAGAVKTVGAVALGGMTFAGLRPFGGALIFW
mmetsp:Transcript_55151/g.87417  ORF Transcript_55151/g.87417 Transcript_55151/m.87417 type:complete len:130 (-) Transcript_55151:124-513(-)|eukprot:CAMPEP_0169130970 /NCGR_PEP_ID=MMETSP1015-20121227/37998_1 /TAXON_ID=342587 /ORGANISM="Karlodinium micrum, Strain CCMP2283" /LENGTH=129 /DNA_ID=CAMNT_0009195201 /DNA_START=52 /DNA_END=441 /DNA_ORIENTATION=-